MPEESRTDPIATSPAPESRPDVPAWVMWLIYGGVAVLVAAWQYGPAQPYLKQYWPLGVISLVVATGVRLAFRASAQRRIGYLVFVLPFVLAVAVAGAVVFLQPEYRVAAIRGLFISVVTLLPATMYYLFITTRKYSLLNEFVSNLHRLGLLEGNGDDHVRRLRALAYLQKFEAAYGPLPAALMDEIRGSGDVARVLSNPRTARLVSSGMADVFTAENAPPLILSTLLIALGWFVLLPPTPGSDVAWQQAFTADSEPVHYAFLGAYFFSIQMLFRRYVLRDLRVSAYVAVSIRIILAVLGTWVLIRAWEMTQLVSGQGAGAAAGAIEPRQVLPVMAFVIGVFPPVAWEYLRSVLKKTTFASSAVPSLSSELPISDLDGLTVWHQSRLEEEDIENVPNMATACVVDLLLNTRIPPDRLVDWVDQAILYTAIGTDEQQLARRGKLRACGIRTASALVDAFWRTSNPAVLEMSTEEHVPLEVTVAALCTNPNLKVIQRWRGLAEEPMLRVV